MASIQFVLHPLPGTDDQLNDRFREISDKINKYGSIIPQGLESLRVPVKEIVIGPTHLGLLLEDGRAFRIAFSINPERLDLNKTEQSKTSNGNMQHATSQNSKNTMNTTSTRQMARSRARVMRAGRNQGGQSSGSRSTGVIIGGNTSGRSLVTVPAPFVPEELVSQAEVVLQGKSRSLIIRELQRTNLDVNLAVNNLLSRDDEELEEIEEGGAGDNYVPEDLISLLDNGFHADNSSVIIDPADGLFSEEIFTNYSSIRSLLFSRIRSDRNQQGASTATNESGTNTTRPANTTTNNVITNNTSTNNLAPSVSTDRDAFSRWRDRQYYGPRRWLANRDDPGWDKDADAKKKEIVFGSPLWISDELQAWPEKDGPIRFSKIASLYSEFIGLSINGELHQWRWCDSEPFKSEISNVFHPKTSTLNIHEKVIHLSATSIRCSVSTESNRVATWMDEQLGNMASKLEHALIANQEFTADPIHSLYTCPLYTVVRTESSSIYWWGVLPFEQRKFMWEKFKAKTKKPTKIAHNDITVGSQVIMKKCPIYQTGSIGFTISNGVPKIGQLLNSAWDFSDVCRFKLLNSNGNTLEKNLSNNLPDLKDNASSSLPIPPTKPQTNCTNNKETADRLDMPPPPSPASSTCSDTGSVNSHKRTKRVAPKDDFESKKDEEFWPLKDVVFVEDRNGPIGKVLKVDGEYVAVRFPFVTITQDGKQEDDWQQCRLLKKDDVQVIRSVTSSRGPDCFQKIPKKINLNNGNDNYQLLTLSPDAKGVHTIVKIGNKLHYCLYNLHNGKQELNSIFPTDCNTFMGHLTSNISLTCANESSDTSIMLLRDGNRTLYPLTKDCVDSVRDPQWLDLPPIRSIAISTLSLPSVGANLKSKVCMFALMTETQNLMPYILRCDLKGCMFILGQIEADQRLQLSSVLNERCDGGRNIIHACITMCSPTSNKEVDEKPVISNPSPSRNVAGTSGSASTTETNFMPASSSREGRTVTLREMMNRLIHVEGDNSNMGNNVNNSVEDSPLLPYWIPEYDGASGDEDNLNANGHKNKTLPVYVSDPVMRKEHATVILEQMCISTVLKSSLHQLLSAKDAQGQTPFMLAVSNRAYEAALILFNTILEIAEGDANLRDSMIFPPGSPADQSPLHVLCYNDTCSFTWTGADHINQHIFECKTCGLTGSLCCCTECAKVCHKGHDCKIKRTSPTAYCDCWEKCKCKALIAGNQIKRLELLHKLSDHSDLVKKFNSRGESILLFLIQTVGRQSIEQRQYRATSRVRNTSGGSKKSSSLEVEVDMPEHDLEPPKFAKKALECLLCDWFAIQSMILTGAEDDNVSSNSDNNDNNTNIYLRSQTGTTLLDKFTHNLFVKCNVEHLEILLTTLIKQLQNTGIPNRVNMAEKVARRFVRSVARVYVIFNLEKAPIPEKRKSITAQTKHVQCCLRVFQTLQKFAIEELCEVADALIVPVRLGVVRPTAPFAMSSSNIDNSDDLFSVEPLAPPTSHDITMRHAEANENTEDQPENYNLRMNYGLLHVDESNELDAQVDGETSEQDEIGNRESQSEIQAANPTDDDVSDNLRNEEVVQDEESDTEFNFNEAETESDSDDNQSTQDAQRSVQTGATAGSDTGTAALLSYPIDESEDSSPPEDDGSEDGETDDHSEEGFNFGDDLERRNLNNSQRSNSAPQSMQWAIRNRESARSVRLPTGSGLVFIDPLALRRSAVPSSSAPPTTQEPQTMATTASSLARAFGIIVRQISELMSNIPLSVTQNIQPQLSISYEEALSLQTFVEKRLKSTWDWMFSVMDGTEAQLKFGAYLTNSTDPTHPLHPLNSTPPAPANPSSSMGINILSSTYAQISRREFFTYCLSLMRSHTSEHRDSLPVLDVSALRHIAYVLDGIIYYMRSEASESDVKPLNINDDNEESDVDFGVLTPDDILMDDDLYEDTIVGKRHNFFQRSESTLSLGCTAPDQFLSPLEVALPLADKPHLLQPNAKRDELFANLPLPVTISSDVKNNSADTSLLEIPPTRLGLSVTYNKLINSKIEDPNLPRSKPSTSFTQQTLSESSSHTESLIFKSDQSLKTNEMTGNLYVQLKKKNYVDQHDDENKNKNEDKPVQMDVDSDNESQSQPVIDKPLKNESTIRPQVIITAKKNSEIPTDLKLTSPSRSVIVRAGPSCSSSVTDFKMDTSNSNSENNQSQGKSRNLPLPARGSMFRQNINVQPPSWNLLLGRWKLSLDLFGRVFMEDVGLEPGSILPEIRGFPVKETRFRRHMEKLRNGQQRDLTLSKIERNREALLLQTFKELNTQFGNQSRRVHPPLTFNRVKVTFKDEPGEGSGVARSFYTSIAEALLANENLPNLESTQVGTSTKYGVSFSSIIRSRGATGRDATAPTFSRRGTGSKILWRTYRDKKALNIDARPYTPASSHDNSCNSNNPSVNEHLSMHMQQIGERLYPKIYAINSIHAQKITGMLLELQPAQLLIILSADDMLRQKVNEALDLIGVKQKSEAGPASSASSSSPTKKMIPVVVLEHCQVEDNSPLFYSPGKRGFYSPRQGFASFERMTAFRNIGRLIGLCLLQNELLPLFLQRHVLKYILERKIQFHDLAFFDPVVYESLRQLIVESVADDGSDNIIKLDLYFVIDLCKEEGGGNAELVPGGRDVQVNAKNVYDYVRKYAEYRMIVAQEKALEALKDGVFDVLPDGSLDALTSEDLRLLLNGVGDINVTTLISYTTFNDESSEGSDKLLKFKRWFWSIVEKMNTLERQDLVYFWTGSPALPASEEGFQPLPSVTIRPADDTHLPTANTCISRLYIPLYSSKAILRSKLLLAIKSKNFGFV